MATAKCAFCEKEEKFNMDAICERIEQINKC